MSCGSGGILKGVYPSREECMWEERKGQGVPWRRDYMTRVRGVKGFVVCVCK